MPQDRHLRRQRPLNRVKEEHQLDVREVNPDGCRSVPALDDRSQISPVARCCCRRGRIPGRPCHLLVGGRGAGHLGVGRGGAIFFEGRASLIQSTTLLLAAPRAERMEWSSRRLRREDGDSQSRRKELGAHWQLRLFVETLNAETAVLDTLSTGMTKKKKGTQPSKGTRVGQGFWK